MMSLLRFCKLVEREEECEPPEKRSRPDEANQGNSDVESDIDELPESTSHDSSILMSTSTEAHLRTYQVIVAGENKPVGFVMIGMTLAKYLTDQECFVFCAKNTIRALSL